MALTRAAFIALVASALACGAGHPASPPVADQPVSPAPPPPSAAASTDLAPPPSASASSSAAATDASAPATPQRKPSTATDAQLQASAESGNAFALSFYQHWRRSPGNIVMSGTSLRLALQMVLAGAGGETAAEMAKVLGVADVATGADVADGELAEWEKVARAPAELSIANHLWGHARDSFVDTTRDEFGAPIESLDFNDAQAACDTINHWCSEATHGRIPEIIVPMALTPQTRLVVTNAIYFRDRWEHEFAKSETKDAPFTTRPGRSAPVATMHRSERLRYAAVDGVQVLELPYKNSGVSMLVVLPDRVDGLARLEERLSAGTVRKWTDALQGRRVDVFLPRFELRWGETVNGALQEMGLRRMFDSRLADLSGIDEAPGALMVSNVIHKAYAKVDEEGTEAAAATAVTIMLTGSFVYSDKLPPVVFRADHPFLFFLREGKRGRLLFIGRVADPLR